MNRFTTLVSLAVMLLVTGSYAVPASACLGRAGCALAASLNDRGPARNAKTDARAMKMKAERAAIDTAIEDLNADRNRRVIRGLYDVFGPMINQWALNPRATDVKQREVVLLVALATLRTEGEHSRHADREATSDERTGNVRWAIRAMENLAFVSYVAERHLAEAWARDEALKDAALHKLRALEKAGRLQSPHQFRLLTRLLRERDRVYAT